MLPLPKIARSGRMRRFNAFALKNASPSLKPDRWWRRSTRQLCSFQVCLLPTLSTRNMCSLSDRSNLDFFGHSGADCSFYCVYFWQTRIGFDRYQVFVREVRAGFIRRPRTVRVRVASGQEIWVSRCWAQVLPLAPDFGQKTSWPSNSTTVSGF